MKKTAELPKEESRGGSAFIFLTERSYKTYILQTREGGIRDMNWKNMDIKELWGLIVATIQALASFGIAIIALIGLWKVSPIIVYQVEQQEKASEVSSPSESPSQHTEISNQFVENVLAWWTTHVQNYQKILELVSTCREGDVDLRFEVSRSSDVAAVPGLTCDCLTITAVHSDGTIEVVKAPVNDKAVGLTQYIQYQINHGAFSSLEEAKRMRVENAIARYVKLHMFPKVVPAYVVQDMSLEELHDNIAYNQKEREDAIKDILALKGIIDAAQSG